MLILLIMILYIHEKENLKQNQSDNHIILIAISYCQLPFTLKNGILFPQRNTPYARFDYLPFVVITTIMIMISLEENLHLRKPRDKP